MREERLKHLAQVWVSNVDKKSVEDDVSVRLCNYTDVYYNERITGALDFMSATATRDQRAKFGLRRGDVVLTKDSETADDIGVSALVAEDIPDLVCGYHLAVVRARPERADGGYVRWVLASTKARERLSASATGVTRFGLRSDAIADLPVPLPSVGHQRAIADYLDRETTRIDSLIAAKRRMVELLEERWVATVTHTTAPRWATDRILKGVALEVPDGWSLRKLGSLTRPETSIAYGILLPGERLAEGVPYLGAGDVRPDRLKLELLPRTRPEIAAAYPRTVMRSGELVYAIRGSFGAVEQIPPALDGVNLSRDAARISPREGINARWLMYALKSELAQEQFRRREVGATITGVNIEDLKSVRLAVPPSEGQGDQAARLDGLRGNFDATDLALNRQLDLLVEHRQALITAAVAGQLDISEAA